MDGYTGTSEKRFASLEGLSSSPPHGSGASTSSLDSDNLPSSDGTHSLPASHDSEAPPPQNLDGPAFWDQFQLSPLSYNLGRPPSEYLNVLPSPHDSAALSFSPLLGTSQHTVHSPASEPTLEQLAQAVSQQFAPPTGVASAVQELARSGSWRVLGRERATSASRADETDPSLTRFARLNKNPEKAAEILQSSWRRPREDHVQSSSQQHDSASLQQPAPQSIISDVYSILKRYSDSTDPIERALRGQIVGIVREHEARYPRPPSHALMPRRHTRVQSKEISDELVAYTVPPIVRLPSTARHNPRSRTKGHATAQVAKTSNVFERVPSRPQRSWPSRIPGPVRNPSPRMHSPTRLNPHTPTSEARTALIGNAFANIAPAMEALEHRHPRRQHPLPYIMARYAGPAFNASPPPSALPVPAFARRIVPTASAVSLLCIADGRTTTSLSVGEGGSGGLEGQIRRPEPEPSAEIRSVKRASEVNVIKTRNREVMDRISSQRASSIPVAPRETDTPTATGAINTEVAPNESETPTTLKPLETPTPPQDIMPQSSSR